MQEIRSLIVARLQADGTLYPSMIPGGVWDRPLKPGKGPGNTNAAFWVDPADPAQLVRLRRTIVVTGGSGDVDPPDGLLRSTDLRLRNTFPQVHYWIDASSAGKTALDAIDARVRFLLDEWQTQLSIGRSLTIVADTMTDTIDGEELGYPGSLTAFRRFIGEYLRPAAVA